MKILRHRLQQAAKDGGVNQLIVERDYAQSYMLLGIAETPALKESLVFKGGTALKKIHFERYRFSEDLDFSMVDGPMGEDLEHAVRAAVAVAEKRAQATAPLTFSVERYLERQPHPGGQEAFTVRVQYPWQRQAMIPIKLEITHDEPVLLPSPPLAVVHGYEESIDISVRAYCLEEIASEKLRSIRQTQAKLDARGWVRPRSRDYYDLWHLVRDPRVDWPRVAKILPKKCALRQVAVSTVDDLFEASLLTEVRASWERTLDSFVQNLPDVELVLTDVRARLDGLLRL